MALLLFDLLQTLLMDTMHDFTAQSALALRVAWPRRRRRPKSDEAHDASRRRRRWRTSKQADARRASAELVELEAGAACGEPSGLLQWLLVPPAAHGLSRDGCMWWCGRATQGHEASLSKEVIGMVAGGVPCDAAYIVWARSSGSPLLVHLHVCHAPGGCGELNGRSRVACLGM